MEEPQNMDSMEEQEEDIWEDSEGEEPMCIESKCLFCETVHNSPEDSFGHCQQAHDFQIGDIARKYNFDCFGFIRMVNYCRKHKPKPLEMSALPATLWEDDSYLAPILPNDGLLQYDIESLFDCDTEGTADSDLQNNRYTEMERRCRDAEVKATQTEEALHQALSDLSKMKVTAQQFFVNTEGEGALASAPVQSHEAIQKLRDGEDDVYFDSYGHFSIHQEMLKDTVRTEFYRDCIYKNAKMFKDKIVLDIGCGTGILSMFAAKSGARMVIGVEMSDIIFQAMDIVRENGYEKTIVLLKGRMEDVTLPVDKVDIIISEWMGYFLLFESMLDTVLWARDRYLSHGGYLLPDFCAINLIGVQDKKMHESNVEYWRDVYGFQMSCMRTAVTKEASVTVVDSSLTYTEPYTVNTFDLLHCTTKDLEFTKPFELRASADTEISAIVGFFDISWKHALHEKMAFSTSPFEKPTHWKQTVFLLESPISIEKGSVMEGKITCIKNRKDPRSLNVTISLNGKVLKYSMQ